MIPYTIHPPESDVDFEKLCVEVLKRHWSRKGLERFGKKGERQFGVDIFDALAESPLYGAQCKLKEQWKHLEPAETRDEITKAKTFPFKLNHYAILTTGKNPVLPSWLSQRSTKNTERPAFSLSRCSHGTRSPT